MAAQDKILAIVDEQLTRLKSRSIEIQLTAEEIGTLKTLGEILNIVQGTRRHRYKDGYDRYTTLSTEKLRSYAAPKKT